MLVRAAVLCGSVLLACSVAAQAQTLSPDDPSYRESRWFGTDAGGRAASGQAERLEEALERYRDIERRGGWNQVPTDLAMGPDQSYDCSRIAALERRLIAEGYLSRGSTPLPPPPPPRGQAPRREPNRREPPMRLGGPCRYGRALTAAVRAFQADRKVLGYGQLGKLTMAQLNRPVHEIVNILEHDVARWRGVSLDPSGAYLLVNIPFFELGVYDSGQEILRMPVIVGQPTWQTPTFSAEITHLILNPDWGIPDRIAKLEYLPFARRDPGYLRRQGITAEGGSLRQKPGPNNPLGRIKFVMPNRYDVYLHDTPAKRAFAAAVKALSHGCIRLGDPMALANYVLRDDPQWAPERLHAAIATGRTQQINLHRRVPVHIIYSTSRVNEDGRLELRADVYGMNRGPAPTGERRFRSSDESLEAWP